MILYKHQQKILDKNPKRIGLFWDTGTGKTFGALELANKNNTPALIITPKGLVAKWIEDCALYPHLKHKVISKENFKKIAKELPMYSCVIAEEAHVFLGYKSQLHKALNAYLKLHSVPYRYFLSATPITATPYSAFALAKLMGGEPNYWDFTKRFFRPQRLGSRTVMVPDDNKEDELIAYVRQFGEFIDKEEVAEIPEQTFEVEYFELTNEQKKKIQEIKTSDTVAISKWTRCHIVSQGIFIGNEYEPSETFPCLKNDRIIELAKENDKIAIFARYTYQLENLKTLLEHCGKPIFVISGQNPDRHQTCKDIEASEKCIVLIQSDCGLGFQLPSIGTIVFASLSFSYNSYYQSLGRFLRLNHLKENRYITLITKEGVDMGVYKAIKNRKDFYIDLYDNS